MKIHTLLLTCFLATSLGAEEAKQEKQEVYGNVGADSALGKLLSVPGVEAIYKDCDNSYGKFKEEVPKCIWEKVSKDPSLKKQVEAKYQEIASGKTANGAGRAPASDKNKKEILISRQENLNTDYNSDPGIRALSDFFGQKLAEVFQTSDEDLKNKKIVSVNHEKFISLYKTELGKSIVNSMTAYCLNVEFTDDCENDNSCKYVGTREVREKNIASLKTSSFEKGGGNRWMGCITGISYNCYENKNASNDAESKKQACLVMDFIKSARKSLLIAEKQSQFYEGLKSDSPKIAANFKEPDKEKSTNDSLTQITSSDLEKEFAGSGKSKDPTSIKKVNDALAKDVDNCVQPDGQIKNEAACKKYLNTNTDEQNKSFVEYGLTQNIEKARLEEKLNDDANVAAYLKEEGYSTEQITAMTDKANIDEVKKQIKDRFAAEKEALIAEMKSKIESKTTTKTGDFQASSGKLQDIKNDFSNRTKDLGDLIKFTNIVSSYLEVGEKNKEEKKRNTASLFAEVNSMKPEDAKEIKKQIENAKLQDSKTNTELGVDTINCYFTGSYKNQPGCDDKKKKKD